MTPPEFEPPGGTFGQAWVGAGTSQVADLGARSRAVLSPPASPLSPSPSAFARFPAQSSSFSAQRRTAFLFPSTFFWFYFSLALSLSSTISFLLNRPLRWFHVE